MTTPTLTDLLAARTPEEATLLRQIARDTEQLNTHGPDAAGLQQRIDASRARLTALGIPEEDPTC
ncbi:hypothetical protein GCM10017784_35550 [Deinococcus indicus]|uniref:hypothetical protein n=1 Tax=Deinococcus indicus TaxID=223556 RepID=UPI0017486517|nr:hypothetical protein [Deinococcus indicus]GHG37894.1 hypothetical protein GCM10017784_35550 [Deinococcus indicus]